MIKLLSKIFIKNHEDYQDPKVREGYGKLSGIVGVVLNLLLFAGKFIAGLLTGAISITADAFNNLTDAGSSIVTFIGFKLSSKPTDRDHPVGHGRLEYVYYRPDGGKTTLTYRVTNGTVTGIIMQTAGAEI